MKITFINLFFVFMALTACSGEKRYVLNQQEELIYKNLLLDHVQTELDGSEVGDEQMRKITGDIVKINAVDLQKEYEKNEVAADLKFLKKTILIEGVVGSIDRGIGESYYIKFQGNQSSFMSPHASMADGYVNFLASLKKGEKIKLICIGDGLLIGTPRLRQCMRIDDFSLQKINQSTDAFIESKHLENIELKFMAMAFASMLDDSNVCWSSSQPSYQCISAINTLFQQTKNSSEKAKELKLVLNRINEKLKNQTGVDSSQLLKNQ